jgi:hypothetical protein
MALFALVFLVVALILVGVGIVVGVVVCGVTALLVIVGILSSSVVVGLLARRPVAGVRALLLQCALLTGIPAGILCAWLAHSVWASAGPGWLISFYGGLGGAVGGIVIALLLDFIFRRLHRWASTKLGREPRRELVTPSVTR